MAEPAEMQARQVRNLTALLQSMAGLAHDFNNMLLSVRASLELIEHRSTAPGIGTLARHGMTALDRGAQLFGWSMALAGHASRRAAPVDAADLVRAVAPVLERLLGPGRTLTLDLGADGSTVLVDADQLELALVNLAANAGDAMAADGVVTIRIRPIEFRLDGRPGRFVELRFIDNGAGMTHEVLAQAMDPFFSTRPDGQGAGLGLAQVRAMAWLAHGTVLLDSERGRGTVVQLLLPLIAG